MDCKYIESTNGITLICNNLRFSIDYNMLFAVTQGIKGQWAIVDDTKKVGINITSNVENKAINIISLNSNFPNFIITFDKSLTDRLFINYDEILTRKEEEKRKYEIELKILEEYRRIKEERRLREEEIQRQKIESQMIQENKGLIEEIQQRKETQEKITEERILIRQEEQKRLMERVFTKKDDKNKNHENVRLYPLNIDKKKIDGHLLEEN